MYLIIFDSLLLLMCAGTSTTKRDWQSLWQHPVCNTFELPFYYAQDHNDELYLSIEMQVRTWVLFLIMETTHLVLMNKKKTVRFNLVY